MNIEESMSRNVKSKRSKKEMERVKKAQEEHARAGREEEARQQSGAQYGSFPGGFPGEMPDNFSGVMPGMAGMPGLNEILSDPEVLAAMQVRLGKTKLNFMLLRHFFHYFVQKQKLLC